MSFVDRQRPLDVSSPQSTPDGPRVATWIIVPQVPGAVELFTSLTPGATVLFGRRTAGAQETSSVDIGSVDCGREWRPAGVAAEVAARETSTQMSRNREIIHRSTVPDSPHADDKSCLPHRQPTGGASAFKHCCGSARNRWPRQTASGGSLPRDGSSR
jgi:hypothetical protein